MQTLTILGATGSIGCSTLDVVARHPDRFRVFALSAHARIAELAHQCVAHRPRYAAVPHERAAVELRRRLADAGCATTVLSGAGALEAIAARQSCMEILGLSLITNLAAGIQKTPLSHAEVIDAGKAAEPVISALLARIVAGL